MLTLFLGLILRYEQALIRDLSLSVLTDISVLFSLKLAMSRQLSDAVITTSTEQKSSQQPPKLQQLQNQPTPSGNSSVPFSLSPLAFKMSPFCLGLCSHPRRLCGFCFQTCHKLLPECQGALASWPWVTRCSALECIGWTKDGWSPVGGERETCLRRWCEEDWKSSVFSAIWPVDPSQDSHIAGFLGWREEPRPLSLCFPKSWPSRHPENVWLRIWLKTLLPLPSLLGGEHCWVTKKTPSPSLSSVSASVTPTTMAVQGDLSALWHWEHILTSL